MSHKVSEYLRNVIKWQTWGRDKHKDNHYMHGSHKTTCMEERHVPHRWCWKTTYFEYHIVTILRKSRTKKRLTPQCRNGSPSVNNKLGLKLVYQREVQYRIAHPGQQILISYTTVRLVFLLLCVSCLWTKTNITRPANQVLGNYSVYLKHFTNELPK